MGGIIKEYGSLRRIITLGNLNSKPSAGHEVRKLGGHFLDPVSGGEVCREAVAGAFYPQGVQRCSFVFANPQITSPSMTRLKPPSFGAYIYIYIGPDLHALYADPPSLAFLCSVAFFLLNSRSVSPRNVAPPSQSPGKVRARDALCPIMRIR